jgi:hypothetical protein
VVVDDQDLFNLAHIYHQSVQLIIRPRGIYAQSTMAPIVSLKC